jgi:sugar fermentation stimulation protein A
MIYSPTLEHAILIKRYKRFLADVNHPVLGEITVHCPNTGSMKNCWQPGWDVWLQKSDNPKRKYPYTWVLAKNDQDEFIGINTHIANLLVYQGLQENVITEIDDIVQINKEVKYGEENSRVDLLIEHSNQIKTYLEVKSVTLKEQDGLGYFPDAVTTRGQKHIRELMECVKAGHRAVLFFMVQHTGITQMKIAAHIDPDYAQLVKQAVTAGVKVIAYGAKITETEIVLDHQVELLL